MSNPIVYTGTFTSGQSLGIYTWELDLATGELRPAAAPATAENPAYLTFGRPDRLYCVCESPSFRGEYGGGVAAFTVGPGRGELHPLNSQPTHGVSPCYLTVDPSGRYLLTTQYVEGTVCLFPLAEDGSVGPCCDIVRHIGVTGPVADRQEHPHAHCVRFTPDGELALVVDLGLDRIKAYRLDASAGRLLPAPEKDIVLHPGAGPRHIAFANGGERLYVACEVSSEIAVFGKKDGRYEPLQVIPSGPVPIPAGNTAAALRFSPNGRFLYASNRGQDSIAVFAVSPADGTLSLRSSTPCGGVGPRDFNLEPGGKFLLCANQYSDNIVSFAVDPATGALTPTGHEIREGCPVCVIFDA